MKRNKTLKVCIFIVASALFFAFFILKAVWADSTIYEISNFDELVQAAQLSRLNGHQNDTFVLTNNIEITEENQNKLINSDFKYISFGSSDYPFAGTFDGQGHYISNLKYESTLDVQYDTGLFSYTGTGAHIKNLTILNADIQSDYRGGIVSGYSEGTIFENITVKDSHVFISSANNVISLITDGGIRGGAIVGEANNCVLYNCEADGTTVNTNNTAGVAALSGKGLYLGGLVGTSIATEIEYSRVIGGLVKNYYDVAVGALGGNTLYVGGIVGQMKNGSKVIDSFSTAELYFYTATYVSVGAGNTGHIGGITGAMYGTSNEIVRCHYAGKATSKQYNAVLVIPIIQNNVNISGITDVYEGGSVVNTYFKSSVNSDVDMNVLGDSTTTSSYGPLADEKYIDKDYWQTKNYDFYGNIKRETEYNSNHTNKWIINYELGIPVHGNSVAATLDFSGAGTVEIGATNLVNASVSTENAYSFAVQGIQPTEYNVNISASENEGYRFISWYKVPNITVWEIEENHIYFDEIFNEYDSISNEKELDNIWVDNNDLFVAYYQARVLFYDINGKIIDKNTGEPVSQASENDWYDYGEKLANVIPNSRPENESSGLIGWTTIKSSEAGGGYSNITASELITLKDNNAFYEGGESITKTMNLYPVYADSVYTVFEGNEQDTSDDAKIREGVGSTSITINENQVPVISVTGANGDGSFPEGYRFIGWYDENNKKISAEKTVVLNDTDLTTTHMYTARFEYKVDYYSTTKEQVDENIDNTPYATVWHEYEETINYLKDVPLDAQDTFSHWGSDSKEKCSGSCSTQISTDYKVTAPISVYAHVDGSSSYDILITSDFPNASILSNSNSPAGSSFTVTCAPNNGYNFIFWATGASNGGEWTSSDMAWESGIHLTTRKYHYEAHLNANVKFYAKTGNVLVNATRHYNENIFHSGVTHSYTYPMTGDTVSGYTDFSEASPTNASMKINNYAFLGWISTAEVPVNSDTWNYIYDVEGDSYCTSDITKAMPYIVADDAVVTKAMDMYPVYAKYNINTKTNVKQIAVSINAPEAPQYTITESTTEKGIATISITPDLDTYVTGNSGQKYILTSLVRIYEDGTEEILLIDSDGTYKYTVEAGKTYTFMANYEPAAIVYHMNDTDIQTEIRTTGEVVGESPIPTYDISELSQNYVFIGWTVSEPENGYHKLTDNSELESLNIELINSSTIVQDFMELWPVYIAVQININSNIDEYLTTNNIELEAIRYITRNNITEVQLNATSESTGRYEFVGWYKNYQDENNRGDLVTNNAISILDNNTSIENMTYTAVYREAYKINYYNTEGEIIYSSKAYQDEPRTFVQEVPDIDGNNVTIPVDYEVYSKIYEGLKSNELFQNWQWQQENGTIVKWDDFYNKTIEQDMNLYPIIRVVTVKDSNDNQIDVLGTEEEEPNIIVGADKEKIYACFNMTYQQPNLVVHIEDFLYKANGENDIEYPQNVEVSLYKDNDITQEAITTVNTDENGNATISLFGELVITTNISDENSNYDLFIFEIINNSTLITKEVLVADNQTKIVKVPYGSYKIIQKEEWAWRYAQDLNETININNNNSKVNITYEEERTTNKWFDSMTYINNEYN